MKVEEKTPSLEARNKHIDAIREELLRAFGDRIRSAIVYGSTLNRDFCIYSDYDILLTIKDPSVRTLRALRTIKLSFEKDNVLIDFNVHDEDDLPEYRKDLFWHNNRGLYVLRELELYGKVIIGDNPFVGEVVDTKRMLVEAVRVINSMKYQARKMLINKDINASTNKILLMKWCIYSSLYVLASRGEFPIDRREAVSRFAELFNPPIDPKIFLHIKITRPDNITDEDVRAAYEFLVYLDKMIFEEYTYSHSILS